MINSSYFYNKEALNSSPDFALKYAGAISNTVLHPLCPSLESLYAALAYATKTLDVNSGLESNVLDDMFVFFFPSCTSTS
jgi:hypothetical protein